MLARRRRCGHGFPVPELSPCGAIARRHDPDRFLCALFAPPAKREALFTLIAFNHELARAREVASNPILALIRLTWWREAVEEAAAGQAPRQHEVAAPLSAAIRSGALDAESLIAMAEAREMEAEEEGIASTAAFHAYLRGTAGGFAVAAGRLLEAPPALLPALQQAGLLYGLAGLLRAVPALAAQGRCLLPTDLIAPEAVVEDPARAAPVIAALAREAPAALPLQGLPREARAAALPLVLARRDLKHLAAGRPVMRGLMDRLAVMLAAQRGPR
ncbi:squalene/phytoene synthase family protein [Roseococcus sp. SDR]|uniref:squalene/phytoene synthase family protein n=1 Tax=Roseococcus sp. SDR TaxID=2835532 RepID=UPI001BCF9E82|nr:squalene/phytoene synthase family protein [Roseococcus sp. SDR]MBS7789149.1 squalene/phytoene synthase family protein [Roseococcus sp. SDR]MBV1844463.1 squalene/phytoene synthase family protein [Roseococcus sp. SDR]